MKFNLTPEDFLKGKLVNPGWHHTQITSYEEKMSTAKPDGKGGMTIPSQYVELKFRILDGPDKDVIVFNNFSEKAPGFIIPFMEALMGGTKLDSKKTHEFEFNKSKLEGQYIDIEVVRGSYNNKPTNVVNAFKPFSGTKEAATTTK